MTKRSRPRDFSSSAEVASPDRLGDLMGRNIVRARRFERLEGKSSIFWRIEVCGERVTTFSGVTGTDGKSTTTEANSLEDARNMAEKQIGEKLVEGYEEVGGEVSRVRTADAAFHRDARKALEKLGFPQDWIEEMLEHDTSSEGAAREKANAKEMLNVMEQAIQLGNDEWDTEGSKEDETNGPTQERNRKDQK